MIHQVAEKDRARKILKRVSDSLERLANSVADIEDTVSDIVAANAVQDERAIKNLQSLDFLRQSLEDLAQMAEWFGNPDVEPLSEAAVQSAANKLKLKSSRLLLYEASDEVVKTNVNRGGELDLF